MKKMKTVQRKYSHLTWFNHTLVDEETVAKFGQVRDATSHENLQRQAQSHVDGHGGYENFIRDARRLRSGQLDAADHQKRPVQNGVREASVPTPQSELWGRHHRPFQSLVPGVGMVTEPFPILDGFLQVF